MDRLTQVAPASWQDAGTASWSEKGGPNSWGRSHEGAFLQMRLPALRVCYFQLATLTSG